jgi:ribosomal-protein-alanine N-acetyltransferase
MLECPAGTCSVTLIARASVQTDWLPIETLNRASRRALPKLWWWEEYLSEELFVVVEQGRVVVGALFAWPDDSPVAWVRLASLLDSVSAEEWLDAALPPLLRVLRSRGARRLAWMDYWEWAGPHLASRGFAPLTDVETMAKTDRVLPPASQLAATVRPAGTDDIAAIASVDVSAFTPHWRYSQATIAQRFRASPLFIVAEIDGAIVGYAEGDIRSPTAHLNRVAVHPHHQEQGIGALLAQHALRGFWQGGADQVTLNTQTNNQRARRLYRRLGFKPTGERATAWELAL